MEIVDESGNKIENPDLSKGYLEEETKIIHHDAVVGVEQKSHYEVVKEYENGGKDLKEVIDVAGIEPHKEYDETITYQKYILYTPEELKTIDEEKNKPTIEARLKATEDALMNIMIGGNS